MRIGLFNKITVILTVTGLLFLFAGCPYSSSVPVDEGSVKIDSKWPGKWIKTSDKDSENPTYFEIKAEDEKHATVLKYEFSSTDSIYESTLYNVTFSAVADEVFMNAMEEGGSSYSLFKFEFNPDADEITTYEITDYIKETFETSEQLKKFIAANKNASYFYTNSVDTYVRM